MRIAEGDMFACHLLLLQMICLQLVYRGFFLLSATGILFNFAAPAFCTLAGSCL